MTLAQALYDGGTTGIATICTTLGISRATLYRSRKSRPDEHPIGGSRRPRASKDHVK
ncbi:MAG: helix-turn-helix domain-containing protein [Chloroflexota bacterium]|nr:helix-turn-helix domain-containing protein [Chloroflexota bacterium]